MKKIIRQYRGNGLEVSPVLSKKIIKESRTKGFIMAGGVGARLAPLSCAELPKQFIKLIDDKSLFQITVERNRFLGRNAVITQDRYLDIVSKQLEEIGEELDIIIEPSVKNTRACSIIAAYYAIKNGFDNIVLIPSDHMIEDLEAYNVTLMRAVKLLDRYKVKEFISNEMFELEEEFRKTLPFEPNFFDDSIFFADYESSSFRCNAIAIGIKADKPSPDFGYIETKKIGIAPGLMTGEVCLQEKGDFLDLDDYRTLYNITKFEEKPNMHEAEAEAEAESGLSKTKFSAAENSENYFWNSGIYFFNANYLLTTARKESYEDTLFLQASVVFAKQKEDVLFVDPKYFNQAKAASFEAAFAQSMKDILMIEASFEWQDLGRLKRLAKYFIDYRTISINQDIKKTNYVPVIVQLVRGVLIIFKGKFILANEDDLDNIFISDINISMDTPLENYRSIGGA